MMEAFIKNCFIAEKENKNQLKLLETLSKYLTDELEKTEDMLELRDIIKFFEVDSDIDFNKTKILEQIEQVDDILDLKDGLLLFTGYANFCAHPNLWERVLKSKKLSELAGVPENSYEGIKFVYLLENLDDRIFINTDLEGKVFEDRYLLDSNDDDMFKYTMFYPNLNLMLEDFNKFLSKDKKKDIKAQNFEDVKKICDSLTDENTNNFYMTEKYSEKYDLWYPEFTTLDGTEVM